MGSNTLVLPSVDRLIVRFLSSRLVRSHVRTWVEIARCLRTFAMPVSMGIRLRFFHCVSRVVKRVCFVVRPVVGDTLDDLLRIVAASECTFGVRPIRFGLAAMAGWHSA